jgi:hypothetical protein
MYDLDLKQAVMDVLLRHLDLMNGLAFHRLSASLDLSKTSKSMLEKPWRCTVGQGEDAASVAGPAYTLGRWRQ